VRRPPPWDLGSLEASQTEHKQLDKEAEDIDIVRSRYQPMQ
jgi:hypothetical protein